MESTTDDPRKKRATTPSNKEAQPVGCTPRSAATPFTENVTTHRPDMVKAMRPEMNICSDWETFCKHYLPATDLSPKIIDDAVQHLQNRGVLLSNQDNQLYFSGFPVASSKSKKPTETERFEPLTGIINALGEYTKSTKRTPSCEFVQEPNYFNDTETAGGNFKVDGYLRILESTVPARKQAGEKKRARRKKPAVREEKGKGSRTERPLANVAVPCEFKSVLSKRYENRRQLLGSVSFCMNDDPRRMYMYGITIEDTTMAIWYFSRSHSVKSPDFNFIDDYKRFTHTMLSFLLADEQGLGFDPTIKRYLEPGDPVQSVYFVYKVGERYFKTVGTIFESRRLRVTGRGTQVWKVVEVKSFQDLTRLNPNQHPMVLKDVWLNKGSMTEIQNLEAIFTELRKLAQEVESGKEPIIFKGFRDSRKIPLENCLRNATWQNYFLTSECDWQGHDSKELASGVTPDPRVFDAPTTKVRAASKSLSSSSRQLQTLLTDSDPPVQEGHGQPRDYRSKQQFRAVYRELCTALHDVDQLGDLVTALDDCVFALQLMFLAGWVHRDISSGNVYLYKDTRGKPCGILGDLEYAKPFENSKSTSDPKTGTAYFMAVEIQTQTRIGSSPSAYSIPSEEEMKTNPTDDRTLPITHHFLHDMESVFWLLLWTLLKRFPFDPQPDGAENPTQEKSKTMEAFQSAICSVFRDTGDCPAQRIRLITSQGHLNAYLQNWLNRHLQTLITPLTRFRESLFIAYGRREIETQGIADCGSLYGNLTVLLEVCRAFVMTNSSLPSLVSWKSLPASTVANAPSPDEAASNKRKRHPTGSGAQHPKNSKSKIKHSGFPESGAQEDASVVTTDGGDEDEDGGPEESEEGDESMEVDEYIGGQDDTESD
ncbi:hypothetical protein FRB90_007242 [Tulasnella sp. 427]|nr:hypothetical protein FRB90_007242 [Tulasnella sp. 427]